MCSQLAFVEQPDPKGGEDDWWETPRSAIDPILPILCDILGGRAQHIVIDPGCGTGNITEAAATTLNPLALIGIEINPGRAAAAQRRLGNTAEIICTDFVNDRAFSASGPVLVFGNPPYSKPSKTIGLEFMVRSLELAQPNGVVALLLPLDFATGVDRCELVHERFGASALYPLKRRPSFGNGTTGQRPVGWFVWDFLCPHSEWRTIG